MESICSEQAKMVFCKPAINRICFCFRFLVDALFESMLGLSLIHVPRGFKPSNKEGSAETAHAQSCQNLCCFHMQKPPYSLVLSLSNQEFSVIAANKVIEHYIEYTKPVTRDFLDRNFSNTRKNKTEELIVS